MTIIKKKFGVPRLINVSFKDGKFIDDIGLPIHDVYFDNIYKQAKQQLLDLYCNSCEVKSSQLEDPSNEGRVYQVEI